MTHVMFHTDTAGKIVLNISGLFAMTSATLSLPLVEPPTEVVVGLEERLGDLCMLPGVAVQALELARSPECSIAGFTSVVERDPKLATDFLKVANSAAYATGAPIGSLQRAVVRLGFRNCQNLIISASMSGLMDKMPNRQHETQSTLNEHSFRTASIARDLNRQLKLGFHGEDFVAALIHDFGRMLMATVFDETAEFNEALSFEESEATLHTEQQQFGVDHCQLGAWFAHVSKLPESLIHAILLHHTPDVPSPSALLVWLTAAADHMANHVQNGGVAEDYDPLSNSALLALHEAAQDKNAIGVSSLALDVLTKFANVAVA